MEQRWTVQRSMIERPDGQQRWDRAYQCILRWTNEVASESGENLSLSIQQKEKKDEGRYLRSCLDAAPTTSADH